MLDDFKQASSTNADAGASASTSAIQPSASSSHTAAPPSSIGLERTGKPSGTAQATATGGNDAATADDDDDDDVLDGDFAKELAQGMEALMKELGGAGLGAQGPSASVAPGQLPPGASGPSLPPGTDAQDGQYNEEEMMRQFEAMMQEMGLGGAPDASGSFAPSGPGASAPPTSAPPPPANFQDAIRQTMDRLKNSDTSAAAAAGGAAGGLGGMGEADLEKLMAALGGGEGGEGGADFEKMMESMMAELMSKDVLYEPLKELRDKVSGRSERARITTSS